MLAGMRRDGVGKKVVAMKVRGPRKMAPLRVHEAAARFGIAVPTLRAWLRERRIPHFKVGRVVILSEADVEAFLERCRVPARVDGVAVK
jgi:excisionase family DNA binding protein